MALSISMNVNGCEVETDYRVCVVEPIKRKNRPTRICVEITLEAEKVQGIVRADATVEREGGEAVVKAVADQAEAEPFHCELRFPGRSIKDAYGAAENLKAGNRVSFYYVKGIPSAIVEDSLEVLAKGQRRSTVEQTADFGNFAAADKSSELDEYGDELAALGI